MLKKIIHEVFFCDGKRCFCTAILLVAFAGCIASQEKIFRQPSMAVQSENTKPKKTAYLTFDDGPSEITEEILDILKKEDIRATFFLIGKQITEDTEPILKRMAEEGHLIGVHTYSHKSDEIYSSAKAYVEDAQKTADRIEEVTNIKPVFYRFPWGSVNCYLSGICDEIIKQMEKKGYTYFDWNVSAEDSVGKPTKASILKNIRKDYAKYNEPVLLMHDSSINKVTAQALPEIIKELKEQGYTFDTIDHREKPYQYPKKSKKE